MPIVRTKMCICLASVLILLVPNTPAEATSTRCSDAKTRKPGLRAERWFAVPAGGAPALEEQISTFADRHLAMSVSAVTSEDSGTKPVLKTSILILQSPDVSVVIEVATSSSNNAARVTVERACINNAMVPWRPYWTALIAFVEREGYRAVPRPRIDLQKAGFLDRGSLRRGP